MAEVDLERYEKQLDNYRKIVHIYESDAQPNAAAAEEVERLVSELSVLGPPPAEVVGRISPMTDPHVGSVGSAEMAGTSESFADFVKSLGFDQGMGDAERRLIAQLSENPDDIEKVLKEMAPRTCVFMHHSFFKVLKGFD